MRAPESCHGTPGRVLRNRGTGKGSHAGGSPGWDGCVSPEGGIMDAKSWVAGEPGGAGKAEPLLTALGRGSCGERKVFGSGVKYLHA